MQENLHHDVRAISRQFQFTGEMVTAEPYGSGHINDTYRVTCAGSQYILQRINLSGREQNETAGGAK